MADIDGNGFDACQGILKSGPPKTLLYEQGGVAGYGVVYGAAKTPPQSYKTTVRVANESDALATITDYRALCNPIPSSVTVNDQFGVAWDNVLVLGVTATMRNDPLGWVVDAEWNLLLPSF